MIGVMAKTDAFHNTPSISLTYKEANILLGDCLEPRNIRACQEAFDSAQVKQIVFLILLSFAHEIINLCFIILY